MSVPIMEPPQPSAREVRMAPSMMLFISWSTPMVVRCSISTHSRSIARGAMPSFFQISCRFFGRPRQVGKFAALLTELLQELERDLLRHLVHGLAFDIDAQITGNAVQLAHILYLEILGLAAGDREQRVGQVAGMVGMGCRAGRHHTGEISGRNHGQCRAAHALGFFLFADKPAGPHVAHLAACPLVADRTGLHAFRAFERGIQLFLPRRSSAELALQDQLTSGLLSLKYSTPFT